MKRRRFLALLLILSCAVLMGPTVMEYEEETDPTSDDLLYMVDDPDGTPANRKVSVGTLVGEIVEDDAYGAGWNGDTTHAPSQNAVYDKISTLSDLGSSIDDTEMTAEDFGDFTCDGNEDGCTLDANSVDTAAINTTDFTCADLTTSDCGAVTASSFSGNLTGDVTGNADTATALAANPTDCSAGEHAISIDAGGNLTCTADDDNPEAGDVDWTDLTDDGTFTDEKYCQWDESNSRINCTGEAGTAIVQNTPFSAGWDGQNDTAASRNVLYDWLIAYDTDLNGYIDAIDEDMGGGDITSVGPAAPTGAALTDGVVTSGTSLFVIEGTTDDTNEYTIAIPSADPAADLTWTFPSVTGTLLTADGAGTSLTALNGENIQDDTIDDDSIDFGDVTCADLTMSDCGAVTGTSFVIGDADIGEAELEILDGATLSTTQINYLASATGTTGTTSTNLVFSTSPTFVTPVLGAVAAGSTWDLADTITVGSVYSGTTSLEESNASGDNGASIIGVDNSELDNCSSGTNIQDCLDEMDAALTGAAAGVGLASDTEILWNNSDTLDGTDFMFVDDGDDCLNVGSVSWHDCDDSPYATTVHIGGKLGLHDSAEAASGGYIRSFKSRGGGIVNQGDSSGGWAGHSHDGSSWLINARIDLGYVDGTPGVGDMPGAILFWTREDGGIGLNAEAALKLAEDNTATFEGVVNANDDVYVDGTLRLGDGDTDGDLYLYDASLLGTDYTLRIRTSADMTENSSYRLPPADGTAGDQLTTDGSGNLSWADSGQGTADSWDDDLDSTITPDTDDTYDLGTSDAQMKDGYFDGTLEADEITEGGVAVLNSTEIAASYQPKDSTLTDIADGTIAENLVNTANPWAVNEGGTGAATFTDHGLLVGSGTDAFTALGAATNGQIPIGSTGADPVLAAITGTANEVTVTNGAGSITLSLPTGIDATKIGAGGVTSTEFGYIGTLTSDVQSQIADILDGSTAFTDFNGDDVIDSDNYGGGSIDPEHLNIENIEVDEYVLSYEADTSNFQWIELTGGGDITTVGECTTGDCTADFINGTDIADESIDSEHYVDGSIDHEHLAVDVITGLTEVTGDSADMMIVADQSDSWALKKVDLGEVLGGAGSGDAWGDAVDADIVPTGADDTYDLGSADAQFKDGFFDGTLEADAITLGGTALGSLYQPLESTLTDIADGTIAENLVNTANPWADNEVADDITITNLSQVQDVTASAAEVNMLASMSKSGSDANLITGTAGTNTYCAVWNADGDLVDGPGVPETDTHASEHAVGGADTVFPADPDADRYLMWDDDPGNLSWVELSGGGDMSTATYDTDEDGDIDQAAGGLEADVSAYTGLIGLSSGSVSEVDTAAELESIAGLGAFFNEYADDADAAAVRTTLAVPGLAGGTYTGTHNFGGADDLEVPNGTNPTTDTAGQIAIDTDSPAAYGSVEIYAATGSALIPAVKTAQATIWDPDTLQGTEDAIPILAVEAEWAEHGITILDCGWKADAAVTMTIGFEEWTSPTDGSPSTIEDVTSASDVTEQADDGTLADASVAAGSIVYVDLDTDALNYVMVWFTYIVNPGD